MPRAILNVSDDFPKTDALNTAFGANWPQALDDWFHALLRQKPTVPPQVMNDEWQAWLAAVAQHGMSALVYTWLLNAPADHRPPPPIMAELRADYVDYIALAERRQQQLTDLVASFEQARLSPIVLKGAALAHWLYDSPELRPSADIDLLVMPEQCKLAADVLKRLGYTFFMGEFRPYRHAEGFYAPNGKISVDLHQALSSFTQVNNFIDLRPLFANSIKTGEIDVLTLPDSLLMASMHLIYNHRQNVILVWLYDIHLLARDIKQWQHLIASSIQWQARYALTQALKLASQFFGTEYPQIVHDFTYYPLSAGEDRLHRLGKVNVQPVNQWETWSKTHLMRLQSFNKRERIHYLKNRIFPHQREIAYFYPQIANWPTPLAHVARWLLILSANLK